MGVHYRKINKFINQLTEGDYLEIGIDRGEGSTKYFADEAKAHGVNFVGVDIDQDQIDKATTNIEVDGELPEHVELHKQRGEVYLRSLLDDNGQAFENSPKFSMVYLDNYDWNYWLTVPEESFVEGVKQKYRDILNQEMTNINSQMTHLCQAMTMMNSLTDRCIVVADDTWFEEKEGVFLGKCSAAVPFLIIHGFQVLETYGYRNEDGGCGVILGRGVQEMIAL